jgi:hypothetical protein
MHPQNTTTAIHVLFFVAPLSPHPYLHQDEDEGTTNGSSLPPLDALEAAFACRTHRSRRNARHEVELPPRSVGRSVGRLSLCVSTMVYVRAAEKHALT